MGHPDGRIEAMDRFLELLRRIVTGDVRFHGNYPVLKSSRVYVFGSAFPLVTRKLNYGRKWFDRGSARLYWLFKPEGYGEDWSSDGDEDESGSEGAWSGGTAPTEHNSESE